MVCTDWRKLGLFLAGVSGLYIILVSVAADFAQVLSLKHGVRLLVLLFTAALAYKAWEQGRRFWYNYLALQASLAEARDFIMRSAGPSSDAVLLCARTLWLFQLYQQPIRVIQLRTDGLLMLDVSQVSLEPGNLLGMHFAIMGSNKGVRAKGTVKSCDPSRACIELHEQTEPPRVGDLAVPIEPPDATDLERLLGNILVRLSE
jgi:hypothetical protein